MTSAEEIRRRLRGERDALPPRERAQKSEAIWKRLVELPEFQKASQALFFVSTQSEVDTSLMRPMARELGLSVAVPRAYPREKRLLFFDLSREEDLEAGPYGILQPREDFDKLTELENPSLLLVPGMAFDPKGNRLGWGGGYYDRFLAGEGRGLPTVGLAFDLQVIDEVPVASHDVPVGRLLTESRSLDCRAARG